MHTHTTASPDLAVLSALAHGRDPGGATIAQAAHRGRRGWMLASKGATVAGLIRIYAIERWRLRLAPAALTFAVSWFAACVPEGLPYPSGDARPSDSAPPRDSGEDSGRMSCDGGKCDDGISCTLDFCDGSGGCVSELAPGFCFIDEQCLVEGILNPENACELCDPTSSTTAWTPHTMPCDDGEDCTFDDACAVGVCSGIPYTCPPDMVTCTTAVCLGDGSCAQ